jgi:hypothetical protein
MILIHCRTGTVCSPHSALDGSFQHVTIYMQVSATPQTSAPLVYAPTLDTLHTVSYLSLACIRNGMLVLAIYKPHVHSPPISSI